MTYAQIGETTFPQLKNMLDGGRAPAPRIVGAKAIRKFLDAFKRGQMNGQAG